MKKIILAPLLVLALALQVGMVDAKSEKSGKSSKKSEKISHEQLLEQIDDLNTRLAAVEEAQIGQTDLAGSTWLVSWMVTSVGALAGGQGGVDLVSVQPRTWVITFDEAGTGGSMVIYCAARTLITYLAEPRSELTGNDCSSAGETFSYILDGIQLHIDFDSQSQVDALLLLSGDGQVMTSAGGIDELPGVTPTFDFYAAAIGVGTRL